MKKYIFFFIMCVMVWLGISSPVFALEEAYSRPLKNFQKILLSERIDENLLKQTINGIELENKIKDFCEKNLVRDFDYEVSFLEYNNNLLKIHTRSILHYIIKEGYKSKKVKTPMVFTLEFVNKTYIITEINFFKSVNVVQIASEIWLLQFIIIVLPLVFHAWFENKRKWALKMLLLNSFGVIWYLYSEIYKQPDVRT